MKKVILTPNPYRDKNFQTVREAARILKDAGLITSHREGKEVCYRAVETPKTQLLHEALETLMTIQCPMEE